MFKRRTRNVQNDTNLKVQLEMINAHQQALNTMKNSYNSIQQFNSIY